MAIDKELFYASHGLKYPVVARPYTDDMEVKEVKEKFFTKDEVIAIITELQLEIEEMSELCTEIHGDEWNEINTVHSQDVLNLIQQKINTLKEE